MLNEIDLSRTDLNLLKLFEVVLLERHVGRAGDRLKLSPSAISHGLRRLRKLLNDPLFIKTPKGVVPTSRALEVAEPIANTSRGSPSGGHGRAISPRNVEPPLHDQRRRRAVGAVPAAAIIQPQHPGT